MIQRKKKIMKAEHGGEKTGRYKGKKRERVRKR